jgi:hypothetical protein
MVWKRNEKTLVKVEKPVILNVVHAFPFISIEGFNMSHKIYNTFTAL